MVVQVIVTSSSYPFDARRNRGMRVASAPRG